MDISTPFLSAAQLSLVPLVMAIVSILKTVEWTGPDHKYAPLLSLLFGILSVLILPSDTLQMTILAGLTIGCISAGVYSGVKTVSTAGSYE